MKNIILFKRRYLMSGLIIILSMVLFWNGCIYVNYQNGGYEIQDNRPKSQADLVIEEEPEKRNAKWEQFAAGIAELPEVEECVRREQIDLGGVLLKEENIRDVIKEFQAFELAGSYQNPGKAIDTDGREKSGYLMNLILVAMDHSAFEGYLRNAGITEYSLQNKEIPVLIEDYPLVSSGGGFFYEPVLKVENNGMLSVWGDQGHSMNCPYSEENPVKGFEEWEFRVLGITSQAPPCYDVAQNVMEDSNTLRFYTTYEGLERFREIHGISENTDSTRLVAIRIKNGRYALTENLLCPTTVQSSGTIRRELKISLSKRSAWTDPKIREALHVRSDKAWEVMREIAEIGNGYGMTDPTDSSLMMSSAMDYCYNFYAAQVLGKLSDPFPMLRHMLLYGILVFLVIICIFQTTKTIAAGIQIRQKEFAVFLSLGMTKKQIAKMVCIENLLCMFGSFIVGLVISGLSGGLMFWTWENSQPIEVRYPAGLVPVEIGFLIVLVVFAVCMTVKNVKTVKMLDIIRDDLA